MIETYRIPKKLLIYSQGLVKEFSFYYSLLYWDGNNKELFEFFKDAYEVNIIPPEENAKNIKIATIQLEEKGITHFFTPGMVAKKRQNGKFRFFKKPCGAIIDKKSIKVNPDDPVYPFLRDVDYSCLPYCNARYLKKKRKYYLKTLPQKMEEEKKRQEEREKQREEKQRQKEERQRQHLLRQQEAQMAKQLRLQQEAEQKLKEQES